MSFLYKHPFLGQGSSYGEHRKLVPLFSLLTMHRKNTIFFGKLFDSAMWLGLGTL